MPVPIWGTVELMMSFPVLLASAFVFPPYVVGFLAFFGSMDMREMRREIPLGRALFNRSNVALSVMAASLLFHTLEGDVLLWPDVLAPASAALAVDFVINATLVILGTRLLTGLPPHRLIQNVYGGSQPVAFLGGYLCFGLMALVMATVYLAAGAWGLLAFAIPVLLARQMFIHWKALAVARLQLRDERRLLSHVSSRIADERRDERLAVAAGIHDDVLPPLYKVHLMGQVLRQDLASGRLLDLEVDLPDLLRATEAASLAFRDLIKDLRESTVGPGGLVHTLGLLVRSLSNESGIRFHLHAEPVPGTPLTHLLIYQVAREALANVVRHSNAGEARISLQDTGDSVRLVVDDDGRGFEPLAVDGSSHFGLQLMRERVELAGGTFRLEASADRGTRVTVTVPVDRPSL
jgi:signal transduction histidine kinase